MRYRSALWLLSAVPGRIATLSLPAARAAFSRAESVSLPIAAPSDQAYPAVAAGFMGNFLVARADDTAKPDR
jgi:hypothetical protein